MIKKILLVISILFLSSVAYTQGPNTSGTLGAANTNVTLGTGGLGGSGFQVTGTWSGTITFQGSLDCSTYVSLNVYPPNSNTAQSTTTSNGVFIGTVAGLRCIRARMTSYSSGTAIITISGSQSSTKLYIEDGNGTPGGSSSTIQYNDSGEFNGDTTFSFDKSTKAVTASILNVGTSPYAQSGDIRLGPNGTIKAWDGSITFSLLTTVLNLPQTFAIGPSNSITGPDFSIGTTSIFGSNNTAFIDPAAISSDANVIMAGYENEISATSSADGSITTAHLFGSNNILSLTSDGGIDTSAGLFGDDNNLNLSTDIDNAFAFGKDNTITHDAVILIGRSLTETGANQTWIGDTTNPVFILSPNYRLFWDTDSLVLKNAANNAYIKLKSGGITISGLTTPTNKPACFDANGSIYAGSNTAGVLSCP